MRFSIPEVVIVLALVAVPLVGCGGGERPEDAAARIEEEAEARVVARLNGVPISEAEFTASLESQPRFIRESITGETGFLRYFGDMVTFRLMAQTARNEGFEDDPEYNTAMRIALTDALWSDVHDNLDLTSLTDEAITQFIESQPEGRFVHAPAVAVSLLFQRDPTRLRNLRLAFSMTRGVLWPPDIDRAEWFHRIMNAWSQVTSPELGFLRPEDATTLIDPAVLAAALQTEQLFTVQGPVETESGPVLFVVTAREEPLPMTPEETRTEARRLLIEERQAEARIKLRSELAKAAQIDIKDPALAGALDKLPPR